MKMFLQYVTKLFQKWFLWLSLVLDVITYFVGLSDMSLQLPVYIYWILPLPGVIIAGYQVYRDEPLNAGQDGSLQKSENNTPSVLPAKLSIALVEGKGYEFEILSPDMSMRSILERGRARDGTFQITPHLVAMRRAVLTLNIRVTNNGTVPIDILAIGPSEFGSAIIPGNVWDVSRPSVRDLEDKVMLFPKRMAAQESLACRIGCGIEPNESLNPAQFAVRFAEEYPDKYDLSISVAIESIDLAGRVRQHPYKETISLRPLREQLVQIWKDEGLREFLDRMSTKYR